MQHLLEIHRETEWTGKNDNEEEGNDTITYCHQQWQEFGFASEA
jgi:hypothetical protein